MMNTTNMLAALDEELSRLRQVRDLLTGGTGEAVPAKRKRGRPAKSASAAPAPAAAPKKKRQLSEEARQRIAGAQKRRWAAPKRG